jgi:RimJ/RimL family protein N-acetyltransferase
MLDYKIINSRDNDVEIITSMKLVTMIDDEMDKILSYEEKDKIKKNIDRNINLTYINYKMIIVNDRVAGAYVLVPYKDGEMIDQIYLFPEYRNNGIGTEIINNLKNSVNNLYVWMYKNNTGAIRLFERLGFVVNKETERNIFMKYDFSMLLTELMEEVKFGYVDEYGNKYINFHDKFKEEYYLQSPSELATSGIGIAMDRVEYAREVLVNRNIDCRTYLMMNSSTDDEASHVFLIYKDEKYYYWYEHSWLKYKGIHKYKSKEELFRDVLTKYAKVINVDKNDVKLLIYDRPKYGINYTKFIKHCIANSENLNNKKLFEE